jgi:hypothetical protein
MLSESPTADPYSVVDDSVEVEVDSEVSELNKNVSQMRNITEEEQRDNSAAPNCEKTVFVMRNKQMGWTYKH